MSGVLATDPVVLHRYEVAMIFCGGQWYPLGDSPCETRDKETIMELRKLPACEASDADLVAMALVLGVPRASRCWTRSQESG